MCADFLKNNFTLPKINAEYVGLLHDGIRLQLQHLKTVQSIGRRYEAIKLICLKFGGVSDVRVREYALKKSRLLTPATTGPGSFALERGA